MDELIAEEIAFRTLLRRPADYAAWARETRIAWEQTPAGVAAVYASQRPRDWQDNDGDDTE